MGVDEQSSLSGHSSVCLAAAAVGSDATRLKRQLKRPSKARAAQSIADHFIIMIFQAADDLDERESTLVVAWWRTGYENSEWIWILTRNFNWQCSH
jgi:hypothetical protein